MPHCLHAPLAMSKSKYFNSKASSLCLKSLEKGVVVVVVKERFMRGRKILKKKKSYHFTEKCPSTNSNIKCNKLYIRAIPDSLLNRLKIFFFDI